MNLKHVATALAMSLALAGCSTTTASTTDANNSSSTSSDTSTAITKVSAKVSAGTLVGFNYDGVNTFRGVPYATAERFQSPKAVESYEGGTYMALTFGAVAPQDRTLSATASINDAEFMTPSNGTADMVGNEQCQYLNVWSNDMSGSKPVVVFIHGGGLSNGSSSELSYYDGANFAKTEDTVFVSVNHRLNYLGFLDVSEYGGEEYANSGNVGLEDVVEALKWVHENIEQFGGDPSNVTIIGQSGGGLKVTTLACMSDTADLFQKVVVWSGGISSVENTKENAEAETKKLVDYLKLKDDEVIDTLTSMSYEELYNACTEAGVSYTTSWGTGTYETAMFDEDGNMNEYAKARTWLIGSTYSEFSSNGMLVVGVEDNTCNLEMSDEDARTSLEEKYGDSTDAIIEAFQEAYPNKKLCELLYLNTMSGTSGLSRSYIIDQDNGVLKLLNDNDATVYNYVSDYTSPYFGGITMHHTGDIAYWFNNIDKIDYQVVGDKDNAQKAATAMADALAAFAKSGDPSTDSLKWEPYTADAHNTMILNQASEQKTDFDTELYNLIAKAQQ